MTSNYGNLSDYGWTCFYDFISNELLPKYNLKLWNKWKELIESNIYDMIQLDGLCIVMVMPNKVNIDDRKRIHSESECAVSWKDGYEVFAWHGIIISKNWILNKSKITKKTIINEENAEKRRCLQEILGTKKYAELLNIEIIDKDIDQFKYPIELYRTKEKDSLIDEFIYFLHVICPSTQREYYLCIPECKNVWEAKSWTFKNEKIEIRHGDCAFVNLKKEFNQPIFES